MRGWLLDTFADDASNSIVAYVSDGKRWERFVERSFRPVIYAYSPHPSELKELAAHLRKFDRLGAVEMVERKLRLGKPERSRVLSVQVNEFSKLLQTAREIDEFGGFSRFSLFDVDISLPQRHLFDAGLFPVAFVEADARRIELRDNMLSMHYPRAHFSSVRLSVKVKPTSKIPRIGDPVETVTVDDETIEGDEPDVLLRLVRTLQRRDPDLVVTDGGDEFVLPALYGRAEALGITHLFRLGRESQETTPARRSRSYFTYGRIVHQADQYLLRGRVHVDTRSCFLYGDSGLDGVIDVARISGVPLQVMARQSPGTAISTMEMNQARRDGYPVMWKKNIPEDFRTLDRLLVADRGGLVYEPQVGIFGDVWELDFASLYPNIMMRRNISPETLNCECCPDSVHTVPVLGHRFCARYRGLIPRVLEPLIARRAYYKKMKKSERIPEELRASYSERSSALKWVLVTCFGYTGYRNARFGRIECHESITALSRDVLIDAAHVAEEHGFEVIHGIVDSLWVRHMPGSGQNLSPEELAEDITRKTEMPLALEGRYKWLVFLANKGNGVGALNRYYGLFDTGEAKVRGVELRRRDAPVIVRKLQQAMLDVLCKADGPEEFKTRIPEALEAVRGFAKKLDDGTWPIQELVITKTVSKALAEYTQSTLPVAALLQLQDEGVLVEPGEKVRYVILDGSRRGLRNRVKVAEMLQERDAYDAAEYKKLLYRAAESMLSPFGYDERRVAETLRAVREKG